MTLTGHMPILGRATALARRMLDQTALGRLVLARNAVAAQGAADETAPAPRRRLRNPLRRRLPPRPKPQPVPADMPRLRYDGPHGARDYLLFAPAKPNRKPALIVMLHGCTQDAEDFANGTAMNIVAGKRGFHVIYPEQTPSANAMRCWNWFRPRNQVADQGEAAMLAGLIEDAKAQAGIDDADIFVAGISAGGAMAATLAEAFPGMVVAAGIHSGLPAAAASTVSGAIDAMKSGAKPGTDSGVPMIVFHGEDDEVVHPANGRAVAAHIGKGASYRGRQADGHAWRCRKGPGGEYWRVTGLGHAWSGGRAGFTHTDPQGPDASTEMVRFFEETRRARR